MLKVKTKESNIIIDADKPYTDKRIEPKIFFGVSNEEKTGKDFEHFTCDDFMSFKNYYDFRSKQNLVSPEFLKSLEQSKDRVWFLDGYLINNYITNETKKGKNVVVQILDSIVSNSHGIEVKFFLRKVEGSKKIEQVFKEKNDLIIELHNNQVNTEIKYKYITKDFKQIHDRFAVIDNQLWHFGSDIGSSLPDFHATSFGWDAEELQVDKFFKELWENGQ